MGAFLLKSCLACECAVTMSELVVAGGFMRRTQSVFVALAFVASMSGVASPVHTQTLSENVGKSQPPH